MRLFGRDRFQKSFLQHIDAEYQPKAEISFTDAIVNIMKISPTSVATSMTKNFKVNVPRGVYAGQPLLIRPP